MTLPANPIVVIGAGPAGLTAAHELARAGRQCLIFESESQPGGLARTIWRNGYGFDIGGHRFYTKSPRVQNMWAELLGSDLLQVQRLSRIYYNGRFFQYPLRPANALKGLGLSTSVAVVASYFKRKLRPLPSESYFEPYIINRFGDRLYSIFFKDYTEKVWGIPCSKIRADWASQRIKNLSLGEALRNAIFGESADGARSLIDQFHYPRLGPGMLWERLADVLIADGNRIFYQHPVVSIRHNGRDKIESVTALGRGDTSREMTVKSVDHLFSTMPLQLLLLQMSPAPPAAVLKAAQALRYRDFISVNLVLHGPNPYRDQWVYIHDPSVRVGRIQNFRNWSPDLVPAGDTTGIGMEYFCNETDDLWSMTDEQLCQLAADELRHLQLDGQCRVTDAFVVRIKKAYPLYDAAFDANLRIIHNWLAPFKNLTTLGRNGLHRYNNQDHSMIMAFEAVDTYLATGKRHVFQSSADGDYFESSR